MTPSKWQIFYLDGDISRDRVRDVYIYVREREKQRDRERERSVGLLLIKNPKLIFLSLFKFGLKNCPLKIITYKVYKPVKVVHWSYAFESCRGTVLLYFNKYRYYNYIHTEYT